MSLLFKTALFSLVTFITCTSSSEMPDGHLLVLKVIQIDTQRPQPEYYNHASLFKVEFDGTVSQYWNYSYDHPHLLFSDNLFAVDIENQLVYLGVQDQILALDLTTGVVAKKVPLEAPNLQFFWNYDYVPEDNAIYGVCTGKREWDWCRVKLHPLLKKYRVEFLYRFPGASIEFSPTNDIYYMDKKHHSIWYLSGISYALGTNYSTGEQIFFGNSTYQDDYIFHDHVLNRTFAVTFNSTFTKDSTAFLTELYHMPKREKILMMLPPNLRLAYFGSCSYDPETQTLIALMASVTDYFTEAMPTELVFVDVVNLTYKMVPLPGFKNWSSGQPITAMKFMPYKH